jgi:FtsP/CotA-like multicopper oxidase with cupredoxin domain
MPQLQAFGTERDVFFHGENGHLLKHVCPPTFGGGPVDDIRNFGVANNQIRQFRRSLMTRFRLGRDTEALPLSVQEVIGSDRLPMWIIENNDPDRGRDEPRRAYPSPLIRTVRGDFVHARVGASVNTHTIHWHGIEPTAMNDGVGKHSFEISGNFIYQFQTNITGTYFYHCHKNTVLHFQMGLWGGLIVDPPAPAGSGLTAPYVTGGPGLVEGKLRPQDTTDILSYDVEKIWAVDSIDSTWHIPEPNHSLNMQDCDANDPAGADTFHEFGSGDFELNNFNANVFAVTGKFLDYDPGGMTRVFTGAIRDPFIAINVDRNQRVLLRYINASYTIQQVTFPVDGTIIAWDGHPLGTPGRHQYSNPYVVPAGSPIRTTSARRFDIILNSSAPTSGEAFIHHYDWVQGVPDGLVAIARIPVTIA